MNIHIQSQGNIKKYEFLISLQSTRNVSVGQYLNMKSGQEILIFFILIDGLVSTVVKPKIEKSAVVFGDEEFTIEADKINLGIEVNDIQDYEYLQKKSEECFGRDVFEKMKYILALTKNKKEYPKWWKQMYTYNEESEY